MNLKEIKWEMPKGLIKWYDFKKGRSALYESAEDADEPIAEALREAGLTVDAEFVGELEELAAEGKALNKTYDYIVIAGALERSHNPQDVFSMLGRCISETGVLLLAADNRLGLRYFCGDKDAFTDRNFDSILDYKLVNKFDRDKLVGRAYAKAELEDFLENEGFTKRRFYSVFPCVEHSQAIFAEDYIPTRQELSCTVREVNSPDTIFMEQAMLWETLEENGMFLPMANGFLIECPMDGKFANARCVVNLLERGRRNALTTTIRRDGYVEKKLAYDADNEDKLQEMQDNAEYLREHGIKMLDARIEGRSYIMPFVSEPTAAEYLVELYSSDIDRFYAEMERLWEQLKASSEPALLDGIEWDKFEPYWEKRRSDDPDKFKWRDIAYGTKEEQEGLGLILSRGYVDLNADRCFVIDGEFVFFAQETYLENVPANVLLYRLIERVCNSVPKQDRLVEKEEVYEHFHLDLDGYEKLWKTFVGKFYSLLGEPNEFGIYYKERLCDAAVVTANRQRMNFSADDYYRIFKDIFTGIEGRQVYLFGSGNYARKFISHYGKDCEIASSLDNDSEKWGTVQEGLEDYEIKSPECLLSLPVGSYKVIVCIKNYGFALKRLNEMGVRDYGVYDPGINYPRIKKMEVTQAKGENVKPKKYHVGYIAGVFDLYHIGHLNMFRRAKEQCDYLIVGIVTDEGVMQGKRTMPVMPFEERKELVQSCRYVDEAVEIPVDAPDTDEAYRRYHFDVQFSGSDYENDPGWLAKQAFLRKQGSDLVFFPYTQTTSSSQIKEMISKRLI